MDLDDPGDIASDVFDVLDMAAYKFDRYQQFSPGIRTVESLALWLRQFKTADEKRTALSIFKEHLVFISGAEMAHLVQMAFKDKVRPYMLDIARFLTGIPEHKLRALWTSREAQMLLAQTLYVGLSDGSLIGLLRRFNPAEVLHDQTLITYTDPDVKKIEDLQKHLRNALPKVAAGSVSSDDQKFRLAVLLDDFTASGRSFFRKDPGKPAAGKLVHALNILRGSNLSKVVNDDLNVLVLFYVATEEALMRLRTEVNAWMAEGGTNARIRIEAIQVLPTTLKTKIINDPAIMRLLRDYFDPAVVTDHWPARPQQWLGYDECGLPVVLEHNTPNNSIPLLWFDGDQHAVRGVFPRTSRHV